MRKLFSIFLVCCFLLALTACQSKEKENAKQETEAVKTEEQGKEEAAGDGTRVITHLGNEYTVPEKVEKIVIVGAIEAMEDSMVLGVKPIGANTTGGEFPEIFSTVLSDATPIGEKTQPNLESILQLKPDVILVSTKFPDETKEKLQKLAPMIPISHISEHGVDNLMVLAELTGKQDIAKEALQTYEKNLAEAKEKISDAIQDEKILAIRIRRGDLFIYPDNVFLNTVFYHDLGFTIPEEVKAAPAQEMIPLEKITEMDPDRIFVQFETSSNAEDGNALEDLQNNPIWQSLRAVKEDKVYVNAIDPILEGGPLFSREALLKAIVEKFAQ